MDGHGPEARIPPGTKRRTFGPDAAKASAGAADRHTKAPKIWRASDLMQQHFEPLRFCVNDLLPEGYGILAGGPKLGKSWIAYQASVAVAEGSDLWGHATNPGAVLNLALEDGERRAQSRLQAALQGRRCPDRLHLATSWPHMDKGGLEQIEAWAVATRDPRLVFIDTFQKIKPPSQRQVNAYEADYDLHGKLQDLARRARLTIVSVMHFAKNRGADWLEAVSGSTGVTGAADTVLALERARGEETATLHATGRDLRDLDLALRRERNLWTCLGAAAVVQMQVTRKKIHDVLPAYGVSGLLPVQVAELTVGLSRDTVKRTLQRMAADNQATNMGGKYTRAAM